MIETAISCISNCRARLPRIVRIGMSIFLTAFMFQTAMAQRYSNSIASTDFDIIRKEDPGCFTQLVFSGKRLVEMPDKTQTNGELFQEAFVFTAQYSDRTSIEIAIDASFGTEAAAEAEATRYAGRLGQLPTVLRSGVTRLVVHQGGKNATAFSDVGLIVVYSENATKRIASNDLEETLFHESVHAAWDQKYAESPEWQRAQISDAGFATLYGKENPSREDLAESALFAFALIHHPDRLPKDDVRYLKQQIPNRILFVESLIPIGKPTIYQLSSQDGAGK